MGAFFTSSQIYNHNRLNRDRFINFFCDEMKKIRYVLSNSDKSEVSYILGFSADCKWVTITLKSYEQGNRFSQTDAGRIAKMLKTVCINITVIDSDCATLDLYDESGKKKDSLIMGQSDDYFGDDIPQPSENIWKPFLSNNSTWEQFCDIQNEEYVFIEEGLSKLAEIIGMDNILFSVEDAHEDEQTVFLNFKKKEAKKEKKTTLNTCFQQIWGEALEPLGFKKLKLRIPYYVRMVNDEIIHIIGINDMKSHLTAFGGIATVYRQDLCLDHSFRQNE